MRRFATGMVALLVAAFLWAAAPAEAIMQIILDDPAVVGEITVTDQSALDANPVIGVITYIGAAETGSVWTINVTTFISDPVFGGPSSVHIDLNSVNVNSLGAGTLNIQATDQNFVHPTTATTPSFVTQIGGTTAGTFNYDVFIDDLNFPHLLFDDGNSTQIANLGPFGPGAFSATTSGSALLDSNDDLFDYPTGPGTGPFYSISTIAVITHTGVGATSFDAETTQVPAPATLLLLGSGLLGGALYARRQRK